jgi:hypothetical protein
MFPFLTSFLRKRRTEVLEKVKIFRVAKRALANVESRRNRLCSALAWQAKVLKVRESHELR